MKILVSLFGILFLLTVSACHSKQQMANTLSQVDTVTVVEKDSVKYTLTMVDNKKDLSCGMPLTAGIDDTAHYKGKVYGFCSKECKDEFVKNPDSLLSK